MSPMQRLMSEAIPTRPDPVTRLWTPAEQDAHWRALCDEIGAPYKRPTRPDTDALEKTA